MVCHAHILFPVLQSYYKVHKVVARCVSHWRQFTARRKKERLTQGPRPMPVALPGYTAGECASCHG